MENKWWEYYAVRYFVGTVIGAVMVSLLNGQPGSPYEGRLAVLGESTEAAFLGLSLFAALGFAFCYIASAPILTLHATRAHIRLSTIKSHWIKSIISLVGSVGLVTLGAWQFIPPLGAAGIGVVIGGQVGLVILALLTKCSVIEEFYWDLASRRAKVAPKKDDPPTPGSEYVTSYRHLREHGNAFAIVVLEGLLAYVLLHLPSASCAFFFLAIWILPATSAWFLGSVLESRLVSRDLP